MNEPEGKVFLLSLEGIGYKLTQASPKNKEMSP